MGAIHGKNRFSCEGCQRPFSWRLELKDHVQTCEALRARKRRKRKRSRQSEFYVLDVCYLCGLQLVGIFSEEASFVKGNENLYHSNRPLVEVLKVITCDSSLSLDINQTIAFCKSCMNSINKWDETHQLLKGIAKSLRTIYRTRHQKAAGSRRYTNMLPPEFQNEEEVTKEGNYIDEEGEGIAMDRPQRFMTEQMQTELQSADKRMNSTEKEYKCDCGKKVLGLDALVDHQLRKGCKFRTNEYPCKYCDAVFPEKKLLIGHKKACSKESLVNGAYECDICGRRFLVRGRVETHKRTAHSIGTADQQLCSYCGRTFGKGYNMKNHLAREHGIGHVEMVECQLCGKKFSDKSSFHSHVKNIHGDHKFECEYCGKKFGTRGMRNHHINEMHNNAYNYKCTICDEQFKISFKFRYHMRKMHSNLQHACDHCDRTFIMRSDLYRHVRGVHMGIRDPKRYPCKVCGRMFPSMYKVKRHATSHGIIESKDGKKSSELDDPKEGTSTSTSIDVHQLPSTEIYTTGSKKDKSPHITTLSPEILQDDNMGTDVTAEESMAVDSVSSIVVSASAVQECINADDLQSSQQQQLHEQSHNLSHLRRGSTTLIQPSLQSSLVPMHQMIVFEDSVTEPGHSAFSMRSSINQVLSGPHIPGFSVPLTQQHSHLLGQQKLPTIQYEHYRP